MSGMTKRQRIVLAALAPACGAVHSPVQVQKLLFLIDREIKQHIDGPHFRFGPYNYGPFDKAVYAELETLASEGYVEVVPQAGWQGFRLTPTGQAVGNSVLFGMTKVPQDYIHKASAFVRNLSFADLVSAIYKAYPDMKANSIFQQ